MAMDHQHNTAMSWHEKPFHAVSPHQHAIRVHYHDEQPISHNRMNGPPWPIGPNWTNWDCGYFFCFHTPFFCLLTLHLQLDHGYRNYNDNEQSPTQQLG